MAAQSLGRYVAVKKWIGWTVQSAKAQGLLNTRTAVWNCAEIATVKAVIMFALGAELRDGKFG